MDIVKKKKKKEPVNMAEEKEKALEMAISQIEKDFGKGSIMKLGGKTDSISVKTFPSGSIGLDEALGVGGIPRGRIIEIYGPESSGKTTLALHMIAEIQKAGGIAAFIDAEHAMDPAYASNIGVDIEKLYISQPDYGEQGLEITERLIRSGAIDVIVIDSVAALTPKAEIDGEMGDAHVGILARLMSQALRKLTAVAGNTGCTVIFINQLREKVGIVYGNPEVTTGGRALKFYSSVRLEVRKMESLKQGGVVVGNHVKVKVVKNKVAPPFRETQFDIIFGKGVSQSGEIVDIAAERGFIKKSGAWYEFTDFQQTVQGREGAKNFLEANPEIMEALRKKIMEKDTDQPEDNENHDADTDIENATEAEYIDDISEEE